MNFGQSIVVYAMSEVVL